MSEVFGLVPKWDVLTTCWTKTVNRMIPLKRFSYAYVKEVRKYIRTEDITFTWFELTRCSSPISLWPNPFRSEKPRTSVNRLEHSLKSPNLKGNIHLLLLLCRMFLSYVVFATSLFSNILLWFLLRYDCLICLFYFILVRIFVSLTILTEFYFTF